MSTRIARNCARATPAANPTPDNGRVVAAMRALSRAQAMAIETDTGIRVTTPQSRCRPSNPTESSIAVDIWHYVMTRGWAVPHETVEGWRISNAGRIALKRELSAKGAPKPGDTKCREPIRRTSSPPAQRSVLATMPKQNDCESPLTWLRQRFDKQGRRFISDVQFSAGERLRRDFTFGSLTPSVTSNWSPVISGTQRSASPDRELELHDAQLRARDRFRDALTSVGPEFSSVLVDVCCYLIGLEEVEQKSGWPRRTGKVVLLLALSALARFYGMEDGQPSDRD